MFTPTTQNTILLHTYAFILRILYKLNINYARRTVSVFTAEMQSKNILKLQLFIHASIHVSISKFDSMLIYQ